MTVNPMTEPIRVLIVDDHLIMRVGIVHALGTEPGITIVGEAENGEEALYLCSKLRPDVVLMDVNMTGMGGRAVTQAIREHYPEIAMIAFSVSEDASTIRDMMAAGASGYLTKAISPPDLADAIRRVSGGETVMDVGDLASAPEEDEAHAPRGAAGLAPQQRRVLALLTKGYTNAEIASYLAISVRTARHHVSEVLTKLGAVNRAEAVAIAIRDKLVTRKDF